MVPPLHTPSVEHVVPVLQGGDDSPSNTRVICLSCNAKRVHTA